MIQIKDIKKGDVFYECDYGENMQFMATTDPYREDDGWSIKGIGCGRDVDFYVRDGYSHYGPKLYSEPQY